LSPSTILEYAIRRLYFSQPAVESWYQRHKTVRLRHRAKAAEWDGSALRRLLESEIPTRVDIMLHSSMAGLGPGASAPVVLDAIGELVGSDRTLLIPSHPKLRVGADGIQEYDVHRSPSTVGLLSELARRSPEFLRSRHPISSVAARGPRATQYLANNLNEDKPLPHGIYSPYARLAQMGGFVVCLGVPFEKSLTLMHVSEETLDGDFPVRIEFLEIPVRVIEESGSRVWIIRVRSHRMIPHISMWRLRRDLLATGAVRRFTINGIVTDVVDASAVVRFMRGRALESGYPFMFLPRNRSRPASKAAVVRND
jgi:aminoglycoside N3'-acetyltransferase